MEHPLVAAAVQSRDDYELIISFITPKENSYTKEFQAVMAKIGEYYSRDSTAENVIGSILVEQLRAGVRSEKVGDRLADYVGEALASNPSIGNIRSVVLAAKRQEVADKLAAALTDVSQSSKIDRLLEEFNELQDTTELNVSADKDMDVWENVDLENLLNTEYDPDNIIKIYPSSINDRLDGGAHKGHHIVVYGVTESGKSALCINASCGFARQDRRVLYFINEDRPQEIILRQVSNLSGMTKHEVKDNKREAQNKAEDNGWRNIIVAEAKPGTPDQIRYYIDKYNPDCVVIDQLRNLKMKADNRVNQLEAAATEARNISKEYGVLTLSVTQAGDSAMNKLILDTGDVDYSNVGIPGQADLMIGIGVDAKHEEEGIRIISLPKNKISGSHDNFPVRIIPQLSRIISV